MRQLQEQKQTVAWFKLHQFIVRGEKEKALSIYKLLSLSIDNEAFNYKLEGDLLRAFDDNKNAITRYIYSAISHCKDGQFDEALEVCSLVSPHDIEDFQLLLKFTRILLLCNSTHRAKQCLEKAQDIIITENHLSKLSDLLVFTRNVSDDLLLETASSIMLLAAAQPQLMVISACAEFAIPLFEQNYLALHKFLAHLATISETAHQYFVSKLDGNAL